MTSQTDRAALDLAGQPSATPAETREGPTGSSRTLTEEDRALLRQRREEFWSSVTKIALGGFIALALWSVIVYALEDELRRTKHAPARWLHRPRDGALKLGLEVRECLEDGLVVMPHA